MDFPTLVINLDARTEFKKLEVGSKGQINDLYLECQTDKALVKWEDVKSIIDSEPDDIEVVKFLVCLWHSECKIQRSLFHVPNTQKKHCFVVSKDN